jgi:aspartate/methionine/tyrosine aminotransferase
MEINYLSWFKDVEQGLHGQGGCYKLMSSNICEPLDLLAGHVRKYSGRLMELQRDCSEWDHPALLDGISKQYHVPRRSIHLAYGASNAIYLVSRAMLAKGDEIVCEHPGYEPMWATAAELGCRVRLLKRQAPGYKVDPERLAALVNSKTKLVMLTNLHNPSGTQLSEKELKEIARAVKSRNPRTHIVVDEIFKDLAFGRDNPASNLDKRFITINSLSKSYGLSNLRCGFVIGGPKVISMIRDYFVLAQGGGTRYLEALTVLVFEHFEEYRERSRRILAANRQAVCRELEPLIADGLLEGEIPEHGCVYFPAVRGHKNTDVLSERMARRYKVFVVPGRFFGDSGRIRLGFGGQPGELKKNIAVLAEAIKDMARN